MSKNRNSSSFSKSKVFKCLVLSVYYDIKQRKQVISIFERLKTAFLTFLRHNTSKEKLTVKTPGDKTRKEPDIVI